MDFVYMVPAFDEESGHYFPDEEGVITHQEARGWTRADPPEEKPFVPLPDDIPPEQTWVTLWHPVVQTTHDFPNNPAALEGAYEAGWQFPEQKSDDPEETDGSAGKDRPVKKKPAKKAVSSNESASADDKEKVND